MADNELKVVIGAETKGLEKGLKKVEKSFDELSAIIKEQTQITREFEDELVMLEVQLKKYANSQNLSAKKFWGDRIKEQTSLINEQKTALKRLEQDKSMAKLAESQKSSLSQVTGAIEKAIYQLSGFRVGLQSTSNGISKATGNLKGFKAALISTGIGALIVLLGALVANWDKVEAAFSKGGKAVKAIKKDIDDLNLSLKGVDVEIGNLRSLIKLQKLSGQATDATRKALSHQLRLRKVNLELQRDETANQLVALRAKFMELSVFDKLINSARAWAGLPLKFSSGTEEDIKKIKELQTAFDAFDGKIVNAEIDIIVNKPPKIEKLIPVDPEEVAKLANFFQGVETVIGEGILGLKEITNNPDNQIKILPPVHVLTEEELAMAEHLNRLENNLIEFNERVNGLISGGTASAFSALGSSIGEALASGGDVMEAAGRSLLSSLGNFITQFGELLIAYGVANLALFTAMTTGPNPISAGVAIAAGVALVAVGSAISSLTSKAASNGGDVGGVAGGGSSSGSSFVSGGSGNGSSNGGGTVVFEIAGTKLIGVLSNTLKRNKALGGQLQITT